MRQIFKGGLFLLPLFFADNTFQTFKRMECIFVVFTSENALEIENKWN